MSLKNTFMGYRSTKRPGEDTYLKGPQKICNYKFSNVRILKAKGSQGPTARFLQAE